MFSKIKSFASRAGVGALALVGSGAAMAADPVTPPTSLADFGSLVDFTQVSTVILQVGGSLVGLYVLIKGVHFVIAMLGRGK